MRPSCGGGRALLELLPHHLGDHLLHHPEDTLVLEQLVGNGVVGVLRLNDDVREGVLEVTHGELLFTIVSGLGGQLLVCLQVALPGCHRADEVGLRDVP